MQDISMISELYGLLYTLTIAIIFVKTEEQIPTQIISFQ